MAIVAVFQSPALTQQNYDEIVRRITGGRSSMRSPGDWPVPGLLSHAAGQAPSGFRVVDVWESEAAFRRFGETLLPILKDLGLDSQPEVYPAHAFVSA